jgi:hypothetical protein
MLKTVAIAGTACMGLAAFGFIGQAAASEWQFKRGYADCLRGSYDPIFHSSAYKRGCRAAEASGKTTGHTISSSTNKASLAPVCRGAVIGRFNPHASHVNIGNIEHQNFGWGVYGIVTLDDGSTSDFVCMFSSDGHFKRVNASDPVGASYEMDHEEYCPVDVTEADRYRYPGCNQG